MKTPKKQLKLSDRQIKKLQNEVLQLRQIIHSIQSGEVDALIVKSKLGAESIFTLEGEDQPYRLLIESLSEGAITLDSDGKIIHCNKKFSIMVNESADKVIGSTIFDHITAKQHHRIRHLLSVSHNKNLQNKFTLLVKNKTEKIVLLSASTMKIGNINGVSIVVTDITQLSNEYTKRINMQKKLFENESLLRRLTEKTNDVFWVMSANLDKIIYISPGYEKVWGRPASNLYKNPMEWFDSIIEEDKNKVLAFINKLRNQEYAFENYHITGINGEKKYILVKGYQNKDKHGKVIDVFGISSDITEFTKISNRLHLNDKLSMVGTLAAGIAHEINNPIAWIRGNLAYIKKNISRMDSIKLEELMDETIEGVDRIIDIVSELKGFSRNNNNELSMTDLHSIIDSALKIASSQIKSHVNLKKNYADNLPLVNVNPGKMQQVFLNLILNAIQSMNNVNMQNNILRITTTHNANQIRIDISDTGSGITPENISKIFDPFFTTKEKDSGTGIGLSISHEIIKNHGGEISVKSTVGQGTTFSIFLPIGVSL